MLRAHCSLREGVGHGSRRTAGTEQAEPHSRETIHGTISGSITADLDRDDRGIRRRHGNSSLGGGYATEQSQKDHRDRQESGDQTSRQVEALPDQTGSRPSRVRGRREGPGASGGIGTDRFVSHE